MCTLARHNVSTMILRPVKPVVAMRAPSHKFTGRIDVVFNIIIKKVRVFRIFCLHFLGIKISIMSLLSLFQHNTFFIKIIMLGRNHDSVDTGRLVVVAVLQGNLRFSIRAQVIDLLIFPCGWPPVQAAKRGLCRAPEAYNYQSQQEWHSQTSFPGRRLPGPFFLYGRHPGYYRAIYREYFRKYAHRNYHQTYTRFCYKQYG